VFGGQGGIYMIEEYNRGACGNMPACQAADVLGRIWNMLEAGDQAGARPVQPAAAADQL
jgi:4-hydroxy-tetrahydrodipicolinate synthase